jgi:hypothetical protein
MQNDGCLKPLVEKRAVGEVVLYVMHAGKIIETECNNLHPDIQRGSGTKKNYWTRSVCLLVDQYISTMNVGVDQPTGSLPSVPVSHFPLS